MPRSLDPNSRITMVLACDQDKPKETRPEIYAKAPTLGTQRVLVRTLAKFRSGVSIADYDSITDSLLDAAEMCLTGWKNIPTEFSRKGIEDVLNLEEIAEVIGFLASASASATDKKKSELPPSLDAVNSANPVSVDVVKS